MAESAEGNRLLSGYRVLSLVPGSNPGLSATPQRHLAEAGVTRRRVPIAGLR